LQIAFERQPAPYGFRIGPEKPFCNPHQIQPSIIHGPDRPEGTMTYRPSGCDAEKPFCSLPINPTIH
jgi:hypothetical protein